MRQAWHQRVLDVVEGLEQIEDLLVLVEQLAHEGGAAAGGGQEEDVRFARGIDGKVRVVIAAAGGVCLLDPQATVLRAGQLAQLKSLGGECPDGRVLDGNGGQAQ